MVTVTTRRHPRTRSTAIARYLGIDYGTRRIGLAVSDPDGTIASPVTVIEHAGDPAAQSRRIITVAADYGADAFVVGLPLNMDGTEGPQALLTRNFAAALADMSGFTVHFVDERLTSISADEHLLDARLTRGKKKARRDAVAAQIILQSFLDDPARSK